MIRQRVDRFVLNSPTKGATLGFPPAHDGEALDLTSASLSSEHSRRSAHPAFEPQKGELMSRTILAAAFIPLVITTAGAAFAGTPASGGAGTTEHAAQLSESFSELHAVGQWSVTLSEMADKRAQSDLVKSYARTIANGNPTLDAKLVSVATKQGIDIVPPDPKTEVGKSLSERMKAEAVLLGSLEGDAFDKEFMTLVTNTQQSVLNLLKANKGSAKDPEVKQLIGELTTTVQSRLKTAQDIMLKIYGNRI
jgi:predicted outer membrane protein